MRAPHRRPRDERCGQRSGVLQDSQCAVLQDNKPLSQNSHPPPVPPNRRRRLQGGRRPHAPARMGTTGSPVPCTLRNAGRIARVGMVFQTLQGPAHSQGHAALSCAVSVQRFVTAPAGATPPAALPCQLDFTPPKSMQSHAISPCRASLSAAGWHLSTVGLPAAWRFACRMPSMPA